MRKQSAKFIMWGSLQNKWPSFFNWLKACAVDFIIVQLFISPSYKSNNYALVRGSYICAYYFFGCLFSWRTYTHFYPINVGYVSWLALTNGEWVKRTMPHISKALLVMSSLVLWPLYFCCKKILTQIAPVPE